MRYLAAIAFAVFFSSGVYASNSAFHTVTIVVLGADKSDGITTVLSADSPGTVNEKEEAPEPTPKVTSAGEVIEE